MHEKETLDPFRARYVPQDGVQQSLVKNIQNAAEELHELLLDAERYDARASHIARKKLEESFMWAVRGITSVRSKA